jgi:hypothetical protein
MKPWYTGIILRLNEELQKIQKYMKEHENITQLQLPLEKIPVVSLGALKG